MGKPLYQEWCLSRLPKGFRCDHATLTSSFGGAKNSVQGLPPVLPLKWEKTEEASISRTVSTLRESSKRVIEHTEKKPESIDRRYELPLNVP